MKRLFALLLICLLVATEAAANGFLLNSYTYVTGGGGCVSPSLTVINAENARDTTSSASQTTGATITTAAGDWLVAVVGADNNGTNGAVSLTSIQDSASNTWTQRALINQDPGAASAGATFAIYTAPATNSLSSGTVTANYSPNTTSKTIQIYQVTPSSGCSVALVTADATGVVGSSSAPTQTTVSITNGDTLIAGIAVETNVIITTDTDTSNGSWSLTQIRLAVTTTDATSMRTVSQVKTVTGTATQTFNVSMAASKDYAMSYIVLRAQ